MYIVLGWLVGWLSRWIKREKARTQFWVAWRQIQPKRVLSKPKFSAENPVGLDSGGPELPVKRDGLISGIRLTQASRGGELTADFCKTLPACRSRPHVYDPGPVYEGQELGGEGQGLPIVQLLFLLPFTSPRSGRGIVQCDPKYYLLILQTRVNESSRNREVPLKT